MKKIGMKLVLATGFMWIFSCGEKRDLDNELDSLVKAEQAFAQSSKETGIKASFLEYLDNESIVFRPQPVNGIQATKGSKPSPASLLWAPECAGIAASGEMGFTTGPWEYRPAGIEDTVVYYGHFISVWKKEQDGNWKVVLDIGVSNPPQPGLLDQATVVREHIGENSNKRGIDIDEERLNLLILDRECSQIAANAGMPGFYRVYGSDSLRFFRDGILPVTGQQSAGEYYSDHPGLLSWVPFDAVVSNSADLGYTYGSIQLKPDSSDDQKDEYGYYVRIWRKRQQGDWKIAVDVVNPAPPPEEDEG